METSKGIGLNIFLNPHRAADFFISLYKAKKRPDKYKHLSAFAESIIFDDTTSVLSPSEEEIKKAEERIKDLFNFLSEPIKTPEQYKAVAGEKLEEFVQGQFAAEVKEHIIVFEGCKKLFNSGEINLFNTCMMITADIFRSIGMDIIGEAFARQMLTIYLNTMTNNAIEFFEKAPVKQDAFKVNSLYFGLTYYYEKDNKLIPFTEQTPPEYFEDYYLQNGNDVLRCKTNAEDNVLEVTVYQNASVHNHKLKTDSKTVTDTMYIPGEESSSFFAGLMNKNTEVEKDPEEEFLAESDPFYHSVVPLSTWMDAFHRYGAFMQKAPESKKENTELTDRCIFHFYKITRNHYPDLTEHAAMVITGYICSLIGVLDNERRHIHADREKVTFREYLRLSVQNALKRH